MKIVLHLFLAIAICLIAVGSVSALTPNEVLVVYNANPTTPSDNPGFDVASEGVARYYVSERGIPSGNLLGLPLTLFTERCSQTHYLDYIATPISDYLSTHPNIKCIVLCYGIPSWMSVPTSNGRQGIDSTLELLGNDGALDPAKLIVSRSNPYYNKNVSFDEFRDSAANTIDVGGGQTWKVNYLVCRLDGYSAPTETVTVNGVEYAIPQSVKGIIDRAVSADTAGTAGLTNAIAVLDDAPYYATSRESSV